MKRKFKIFQYKGSPVNLDYSLIFVVPFYFFFYDNWKLLPIFVLTLLLLVLFHELGHAYICNRLKVKVYKIDISFLMGVCTYERPYYELEDIYISWGGILAQLIILVIAFISIQSYLILNNIPDLRYSDNDVLILISHVLIKLNIFIIFINLVPVKGLDGYFAWKIIRNITLSSFFMVLKNWKKNKRRKEKLKVSSEKIASEIISKITKTKKD
jgi:Zn-dependent protease